ncbi:patatin-like phospholipase family protein [Bryobacter aggregatus]|uniref:patatin-like phospholipase family protein n=1 Tax=Bryobacter aggregatus TaxID=360054 RepID=UPI002351D69B|nr:patatin-like phospholipase family protein [Bryobacter aggregatus]
MLCHGQTQTPKSRPRVALVLEGGAALGFAHIGVLEWFEANHIPIDLITGASMGGLIGGFYSIGIPPTEIREIARTADWAMLLGGETAFADLAYRRKQDKLAYPNRIEVGITRKGLSLPPGLNDGHQIGLLLSRLTLAYPPLQSFDELPTRFRCVSADLVSGSTKVWDSGSLNEALRSTMSIPGVFSPVRKDNAVYVDGGTLDNLPVDVAKKVGADLIIAVHLSKGPVDPKSLSSFGEVMGRSISVMVGADEMRTIREADIVLVADLAQFESTAYHRNQEIVDAGVAAAEAKAKLLKRFALDDAAWADYQRTRAQRTRSVPPSFSKVVVEGPSRDTGGAVQEQLTALVQHHASIQEIETELTKTVGLGRYASIRYQQKAGAASPELEVVMTKKENGSIVMNPAIEINGVDTSNTRFSIGTRITWLDILGYRSEWRNDFWFGAHFGASSELYKPLRRNSRFFVAPRLYVDSNPFDFYLFGSRLAEYRLRQQGLALDTGMSLNRFSELRLGYQFNWIQANLRVGLPLLGPLSIHRDAVTLRYNYEGQDDAVVPRRGIRFNSRAEYYPNLSNSFSGYGLAEAAFQNFIPISKQNSLLLGASAGGTAGPLRSSFFTFSLGGPQRLGAYGLNEILARNYAMGTFGVVHELKSQPSLLGSRVYLAGFGQFARSRDVFDDVRFPMSATGAVVVRSAFGPIFIGASMGDSGHRKWFFGVGRLF